MASVILENKSGEQFQIHPLPAYAQFSSVMDTIPMDLDMDGFKDIALRGNQYDTESNTTRLDAGRGPILKGDGKLGFEQILQRNSGFIENG